MIGDGHEFFDVNTVIGLDEEVDFAVEAGEDGHGRLPAAEVAGDDDDALVPVADEFGHGLAVFLYKDDVRIRAGQMARQDQGLTLGCEQSPDMEKASERSVAGKASVQIR